MMQTPFGNSLSARFCLGKKNSCLFKNLYSALQEAQICMTYLIRILLLPLTIVNCTSPKTE